MPSALALPDEIICEILTLVGSNKPSLCSLARASRRFSILASQCIFRDVNLGVQLRNPSWPKTFHLFFRSLEENPSLASQVHALDLGWNDPRTGRTNFDICLRANDLLAKLTNLQSLAIEANGPRDYLWKPTFLETIPMSSLRSITLSHDSTTIADVITLMQIESLEHLDVQELDLGAPAPATVALGRKASLLSTLYFGGVFSVPENILWTLLQLAPSLKELRCSIPGPKAHPGLRQYAAFPTNMGSIANALEPVQHCLVRLVLFQGKLTNWALYGDSCLDLSQFRSLKIVEAPIPCFFRARGPDASRNSVYALLPSTLEELDVSLTVRNEATTNHNVSGTLSSGVAFHLRRPDRMVRICRK